MVKWIISVILFLFTLDSVSAMTLNDKIIKIWGKELWNSVIQECNYAKISKDHCKITASFIGWNESTYWKNAYRNNIFWNWFAFKTKYDSIKDFVNKRYNRFYYKIKYIPSHFYSNNIKVVPLTNYCRSEWQSNWKLLQYCPQWYINSMKIYKYLITK